MNGSKGLRFRLRSVLLLPPLNCCFWTTSANQNRSCCADNSSSSSLSSLSSLSSSSTSCIVVPAPIAFFCTGAFSVASHIIATASPKFCGILVFCTPTTQFNRSDRTLEELENTIATKECIMVALRKPFPKEVLQLWVSGFKYRIFLFRANHFYWVN